MSNLLDPRIVFLGNSSIGLFGFSTDQYTLIPENISEKLVEQIEFHLKTKTVKSVISNTHLNGLFAVGNSNHLLVPDLISDHEYQNISNQLDDDVTLHILDSKITALGNTIVTSNNKAIVHTDFQKNERKKIEDLLDVEVISKTFSAGSVIGSMIFLSSKGFLTHPLFKDEEVEWLSQYFGLRGDIVTVNRGTPYPRLGIIANNNGVLVGSDTSGPEILRITEVLSS